MERLYIHSDFDAFENYFGRFKIWAMTKKVFKVIYEVIQNFTTLLRHPNAVNTQGYADNSLRSCNALREDGHKFGQCLTCGRFHSFNSCKFCNSTCFKCGDIEHIQSVCNTTVHITATNIMSCNSDSTKSSIYNDHLSLSTILKDSVESYSSSELNETQNPCEKTVSNQSICQNPHVIVPDMAFPNDPHISDEIPCKSEKNVLSEHNYGRKPGVVFMDADFSNNPMLGNDILNKFEETISEESNLVVSNIICPHNAFASCENLFNAKHEY
ncbi:unnamed protein product [Schistosoma curassoni]|uniref:CCHC-type domain-containing protein n=1 Tax=Schistosoma curassoni TaxID=6186 RepID=A0A183JGP0_9TREM|nr:unnamed protein product [Schistosoma curassoni]